LDDSEDLALSITSMGETKWIKEENFGVWLQSVDVICIAIPAAKLLVEVLKQ